MKSREMSPRSKRLRSGESGICIDGEGLDFGGSPHPDVGGSRWSLSENAGKCVLEMQGSECGSFASRCSVRMIHEVVSKFDSRKKELVKSIGFGGILYFPPMKQINRKFSMWLMSCVNVRLCTFDVGRHISLKMSKYDVGHVFGIPWSGKPVLDSVVGSREAKQKVIDMYLGCEFREQRSIKYVQELVERDYGSVMSELDANKFVVAFVVFVISNLFCPSAKYDYAAVDYWNAIQDPHDIKNHDWCGFVLTRLLESVSKMKQDIGNNIKFPNITGCALFLQVFYLDSLFLGELTLCHDSLPRIRVFSFDTIRAMMLADKNYVRHLKGDCGLPIGQLRDASGYIYSWALEDHRVRVESTTECLHSIWEAALALVHFLGIPLEAAGPLYVAVADFQEQMNSGVFVTGNSAVKFLSVLLSLLTPYKRGYRYEPSYSVSAPDDGGKLVESAIMKGTRLLSYPIRNRVICEAGSGTDVIVPNVTSTGIKNKRCGKDTVSALTLDEELIGDDVQLSIQRAVQSINHLPHSSDVTMMVASTMAKFYSIFRMLKPANNFDLNAAAEVANGCSSSSSSSEGCECQSVPSPWELGFVWQLDGLDVCMLSGWLKMMSNDESMAIVHRHPKYIQVSYRAMCSQFMGCSEMELDLFDALVRVMKQEDDMLYASYGSVRWREYFESDFMALVLSGSCDVLDSSIREHLPLSEQSYDLRRCKMVYFPALLHHQWVCFVWHPDRNLISVFDPSYGGPSPQWRVSLVERACFLLKHVLFTLSSSVFHGVSDDVRAADLRILNIGDHCIDRVNRTGVLCSMFYRCYDGRSLNFVGLKANVEMMSVKLLSEVSELKGNSAFLRSFHHVLA